MSQNYEPAKLSDDEASILHDSLEVLAAGLGSEMDKRSTARFVDRKHLSAAENRTELEDMYRTDWSTGKLVDIVPEDMTREWRRFTTDDFDENQIEELVAEEQRLSLQDKIMEAHKWSRLYGGAGILLGVDDGREPHEPLVDEALKPGQLRYLKVFDRHFLHPSETLVHDPLSEEFGMPEEYRLAETSVRVHHSRIIRFEGLPLPLNPLRQNNYWGDSVVARAYNTIINANSVVDSAASMVFESNVDVVKVKGLMNYLQTAEGTSLLHKRFSLDKFFRSFLHAHLVDTEEQYERHSNTFAGVPDLIDRMLSIYAAAGDVPATRMLGKSPDGLNSTGEGDLANYYDKVRSDQNRVYRPKLDRLDKLMARNIGWKIEGKRLTYKFNSLFQLTDEQKADLEKKNSERDRLYWDMEVLPSSVIARDLKQKGVYENITDEHIEYLEEIEKEERKHATVNRTRPTPGAPVPPTGEEEQETEEGSENQDPDSPGV